MKNENLTLQDDNRAREQACRESIRLWPNPEAAPDVPPENVLRRFLEAPDDLAPDLAEQIRRSPNCRRALDRLAVSESDGGADAVLDAEFCQKLRETLVDSVKQQADKDGEQSVTEPKASFAPAEFGQIWTTRSEVEIWDGERLGRRWTFSPPSVLVVRQAREMPWDDSVLRVVPVTPSALWPEEWIADDEMSPRLPGVDSFVAHLWLNYPMSRCQLAGYLGVLPEEGIEALRLGLAALDEGLPIPPDEQGGLPLDPIWDADVILERERLHTRAAWLSATADARRLWYEDRAQISTVPERVPIPVGFRKVEYEEPEYELAAQAKHLAKSTTAKYEVEGTDLTVKLMLETNGKYVDVLVLDTAGEPSTAMDGSIVTMPAEAPVPVSDGEARIPVGALREGFRMRTPDGSFVVLHSQEEAAKDEG